MFNFSALMTKASPRLRASNSSASSSGATPLRGQCASYTHVKWRGSSEPIQPILYSCLEAAKQDETLLVLFLEEFVVDQVTNSVERAARRWKLI